MTFQPENYQQPMGFETISLEHGLMAIGCVTVLPGRHICLGNTDIFMTDGRTCQSIANNRVRRALMGSISPTFYDRCKVVGVTHLNEVWFCIPSSDSVAGELDTIWTWNSETDAWGRRTPPPGLRAVVYGLRPSAWGYEAWEDDEDAWQVDETTWGSAPFSPGAQTVGGICEASDDYEESAVQLCDGFSSVMGEDPAVGYFERTGLAFPSGTQGEYTERGFISEVVLIASGAPIGVQIGSAETRDGYYTWSSSFTWTPGTTTRLPFRSPSGLYFGYRLTWDSSVPGASEVSEITLVYHPQGRR
jgi:hypothetical protein